MLFAALDYWQYLRQRGPYSHTSLEHQGGLLLTPTNFPDPADLKVGDLFLVHTRTDFRSWAVMYATSSVWSHIALVSEFGYLLDATTSGIVEHPFNDFLDSQSYGRFGQVPYRNENDVAQVVAAGRAYIGNRFSWKSVCLTGLQIVLGRHPDYHPKLMGDVLVTLMVLALPGLRWRKWAYCVACIVLAYLIAVLLSKPLRDRASLGAFGRPLPGDYSVWPRR